MKPTTEAAWCVWLRQPGRHWALHASFKTEREADRAAEGQRRTHRQADVAVAGPGETPPSATAPRY